MKRICLCVGTRPNFIKAAPLIRAFEKCGIEYRLVHTGQHYDYNMAGVFFKELGIPNPDSVLSTMTNIGSRAGRISSVIKEASISFENHKPDIVMILGDVDSSLGCALAAHIMKIEIAHVEAGERCGDNNMVEERNRKLIDSISGYLFCASENSLDNLVDEGYGLIPDSQLYLVGNTMIDQLKHIEPSLTIKEKVKRSPHAVLTLHRAENVDNPERLNKIWDIVSRVGEEGVTIIFPCHPRTRKQFEKMSLDRFSRDNGVIFSRPLSYNSLISLIYSAKFVMTDSGGLQMETSYLNVPCMTLRESTEWLETVSHGTNIVTGLDECYIMSNVNSILRGCWQQSRIKDMPLHDGMAAERIVEILKKEA